MVSHIQPDDDVGFVQGLPVLREQCVALFVPDVVQIAALAQGELAQGFIRLNLEGDEWAARDEGEESARFYALDAVEE